jgi:pyruvate dehydrogenase E2 component (dihydrolipoamide acetyltransferase)
MPREFCLPDLGSGLQEGQIVTWLVEVGQEVTTADNLCEVETEKAVIEIPVPYSGTIMELAVPA